MNSNKEKQYDKSNYFVTKSKIIKIVIFVLIFITLLYFGIKLFSKIFDEKSIDVNGIEELDSLNIETYDVKALSLDLTDNQIIAVPISYRPEDSSVVYSTYYITSATNFYKRVVSNTINDNGETFSTIDYEIVTRSDLQEILDSNKDGILTYFWTDASNKCLDILISYE